MYFMHYSCVVITLFNTDLYKSSFPSNYFENLAFHLSVFCVFCLFCFELDVILKDLNICLIIVYVTKCSVALLSLCIKYLQ